MKEIIYTCDFCSESSTDELFLKKLDEEDACSECFDSEQESRNRKCLICKKAIDGEKEYECWSCENGCVCRKCAVVKFVRYEYYTGAELLCICEKCAPDYIRTDKEIDVGKPDDFEIVKN